MKVTVKEDVNRNAGDPIILKLETHDLIVLKLSSDGYGAFEGVVLHSGIKERRVGEYCKCLDENCFVPFFGEIIWEQ
jgi:hypothetical protein